MQIRNAFNHKKNKNEYDKENVYKFKKPIYVKDDLETFNRLMKKFNKVKKDFQKKSFISGGGGKKFKGSLYKLPEQNQRVTFKMSYSNSLESHTKYIKYYMPQENKDYVQEKPELFGMSDEEYDKHKVPLNFKCIISPESQEIDLETLTESFITRLENQTGYKLCWKACVHKDTDHKHAHIVINGKDLNGEDVFFNKETIDFMRLMCSNAATQMIGERTKKQIELSKSKKLEAKRWTDIDEKIKDKSVFLNGTIYRENLPMEIENRLSFLSSIKLAKLDRKNNLWKIKENFEEVLKASGRYNTFLEEYSKNPEDPIELYTGGNVSGKVEKVITFDKDEAWNDAIILRQKNGKRIYVPVWQLHKENLLGKNVSIKKSGNETKISRQVRDKNIIVRD